MLVILARTHKYGPEIGCIQLVETMDEAVEAGVEMALNENPICTEQVIQDDLLEHCKYGDDGGDWSVSICMED
jgi:predicted peroxiredoxin